MSSFDKAFLSIVILVVALAGVVLFMVFSGTDEGPLAGIDVDLESKVDDSPEVRRKARTHRVAPKTVESLEETVTAPAPRIVTSAKSIVGIVNDNDDQPLEGVEIHAKLYIPPGEINFGVAAEHEETVKSDENGQFTVGVPGNGAYRVILSHAGYMPVIKDKVRAGDNLEIKMEIGGTLTGLVVAKSTQKPIGDATVMLRKLESPWKMDVKTDEKGRFTLEGLFIETLYATVTSDEHLELKDEAVEIVPNEVTEATFTLNAGRSITGTVNDDKKQSIANAVVEIDKKKTTTDDIGQFRLTGLTTDAHRIKVVADGYLTHSQSVNLSGSRETAEITVTLRRGGTVTGMVIDETGITLEGVTIKVFQSWGNNYMYETGDTRFVGKTDADGRFEITGISKNSWGGYRIRASYPGFADSFSKSFKIKDEKKPVNIQVVMRTGGLIAGTVYDEQNRAIPGVKLTLTTNGVNEWSSQARKKQPVVITDDKGTYSFDKLAPAKYYIAALAPGYASRYKSNIEVVGSAEVNGIDLHLESGKKILGKVTNEEKVAIVGAQIYIYSKSSWAPAVTDEEGNYEITNVGEGPYTATATSPGYSRERKKKVFPVGDKLDFELKRDGYVWGIVTDTATKKPVSRFTVQLHQKDPRRNRWSSKATKSFNDPEGKFKLYAKDGTYKLVVRSKGHIVYEKENVVLSVDAEPEELEVKLVPGGAVEGWVRDFSGQAMRGARVYVRSLSNNGGSEFLSKTSTEADGYFFIGSLVAGMYEFAFHSPGRAPIERKSWVSIYGGEITEVRMDYREPAAIYVTATDDKERPLGWTRYNIEALGENPVSMKRKRWSREGSMYALQHKLSGWVDQRGIKNILDLPPGAYKLTATKGGFKPIVREFAVREGAALDLSLIFKRNAPKPKKRSTGSQ